MEKIPKGQVKGKKLNLQHSLDYRILLDFAWRSADRGKIFYISFVGIMLHSLFLRKCLTNYLFNCWQIDLTLEQCLHSTAPFFDLAMLEKAL